MFLLVLVVAPLGLLTAIVTVLLAQLAQQGRMLLRIGAVRLNERTAAMRGIQRGRLVLAPTMDLSSLR